MTVEVKPTSPNFAIQEAPLFTPPEERQKPEFPQPLGPMTPADVMNLQDVFVTLPRRFNDNEIPEIDLDTFGVVRNSAHKSAQVIVHEEGFDMNAQEAPDTQKQDMGRSVFRGLRRDPEYYKWVADFSGEEREEVTTHDIGKIELRLLSDTSQELTPGTVKIIDSDKKAQGEGKTSETPEYKGESIDGEFEGKHIVSLGQFSRGDLEAVFKYTPMMRDICLGRRPSRILEGLIIASLFFKESSRTRASSEAAVLQLGGDIISILDPKFSSMAKGESLKHTLLTFESYSDGLIMRHEKKGSVGQAAQWLKNVPVINAGDGDGEHPTQAILDLNTIYDQKGTLQGLNGVVAGDLSHGRTVHSLVQGLALYPGNTLTFLSNDVLRLPEEYRKRIEAMGVRVREIDRIEDIPQEADFWYWTRSQTERYTDEEKARLGDKQFVVTQDVLDQYAGPNTILMHPLPINDNNPEILPEVEEDPRAIYLKTEIRNGMYTRMALFGLVMGRLDPKGSGRNGPNIF